jgi:hypothetical protein
MRTVDLDDPAVLVAEGLRPSRVATRERTVSQRLAAGLVERHRNAGALSVVVDARGELVERNGVRPGHRVPVGEGRGN